MEMVLEDYNGMRSAKKLDIVLFDFAIQHVLRIARIIRTPYGNALVIGVGGTGRQSLSRLAAIVQEFEVYQIEMTKAYSAENWKDDLKIFLHKSGIEETKCVFILADAQIKLELFLEHVNSLLNSGEVPNLYTLEERA
jgi:dynein heavy chain